MQISYRRTPPSLLERAFARLVKRQPVPTVAVVRVDLVRTANMEFTQD